MKWHVCIYKLCAVEICAFRKFPDFRRMGTPIMHKFASHVEK